MLASWRPALARRTGEVVNDSLNCHGAHSTRLSIGAPATISKFSSAFVLHDGGSPKNSQPARLQPSARQIGFSGRNRGRRWRRREDRRRWWRRWGRRRHSGGGHAGPALDLITFGVHALLIGIVVAVLDARARGLSDAGSDGGSAE